MQMMRILKNHSFIFYFPRVLSCIYILFLSLFALDVLTEYIGWSVILPLFIHLLPAIVLLVTTIFAWKYELVGVLIFLAFALLYVFTIGLGQPWSWYVVIPLPATLVSLFFFLSWLEKKRAGISQ